LEGGERGRGERERGGGREEEREEVERRRREEQAKEKRIIIDSENYFFSLSLSLSLSLSYLDARGSLEGEVVEVHRAVASAAVLKLLLWDDGERKKRAIAGGDD
jgi:hypothetical protein